MKVKKNVLFLTAALLIVAGIVSKRVFHFLPGLIVAHLLALVLGMIALSGD